MWVRKTIWWLAFFSLFLPLCLCFLLYAAAAICGYARPAGYMIQRLFQRFEPFDRWAGWPPTQWNES